MDETQAANQVNPVNQIKFVKLSQGQINFITQLLSNVSVNGMQVPLQDLMTTLQDLNTEAMAPKVD